MTIGYVERTGNMSRATARKIIMSFAEQQKLLIDTSLLSVTRDGAAPEHKFRQLICVTPGQATVSYMTAALSNATVASTIATTTGGAQLAKSSAEIHSHSAWCASKYGLAAASANGYHGTCFW